MHKSFQVHLLNDQGIARAEQMALEFNHLVERLEPWCKDSGREWAIVQTKLEEASFFAKKAMASQVDNQK